MGLAVSTTLCLHSRQIWGTERPSNWSSALLKDGYLNLLLHSKNVVKRGWEGRKIRLKKRIECFFQSLTWLAFLLLSSYSTVYKLSLTVATTLVQSPKLFKLNDEKRLANKLRDQSMSPKLRKTVSIPEVILQSTFSRTVTSLSKQKRVNAHGHNSATSKFDDETSSAFYSWELTQPRGANNSILKICATTYLFPEPVTIDMSFFLM